MLFLEHIIKFC